MENDEDVQTQATQQQTQSTQHASQPNGAVDAHLFGYLQPCSATSKLLRIDFWKMNPKYKVGRNTEQNNVVFPGFKVSNLHCEVMWDGRDTDSSVTVKDLSSNGTFINGTKIGKGLTGILRHGNEIAFGTSTPQPQNDGLEDYRFIFRNTVAGPPTVGIHAFYDIHSELGKGSFATVVRAVCRATGEWFAVKIIHGQRNNNREATDQSARRAAFAREIAIMEKLKHPNICGLKEVFADAEPRGDICLVLELVEGGDLLDYILNRDGLTEQQTKHITRQMCSALAYIHSKGVTHRDLKPENVLLTRDDPPVVKVADFGLAKVVDSLTMLRTMCGTPSYLAPEVVRQQNSEGYDNLVDSWSVGVIVFSMLTNSSPFLEDENQRDIRRRISERCIDWSTLHRFNVTSEAQDFIGRLLEEEPTKRMTLTQACSHPWLLSSDSQLPPAGPAPPAPQQAQPIDFNAPNQYIYTMANPAIPESNSSFLDMKPLKISSSSLDNILDSHPYNAAGVINGVQREVSRTPLVRRSHVLQAAANGGAGIPEPSWDMIAHAEAQDKLETSLDAPLEPPTSSPEVPAAPKGQKRVHSELTPLSEDMDSDREMADADAVSGNRRVSRKKGKSSDEDSEEPSEAAETRRSTRSKAAPSPAIKRTANKDEAVPTTRRSARQPQKQARRS
ncbi:Pkinase-domain-containing protein [Pluteus cervinus]|uniref:Pkinase-domain-containing protein n=1 Tax=Pluteus cervinus TaxID=181527 RepID=A0ACD3B8E4_9AGAR|nr:Pkinase-domain-containing protein [Pluteus cervinus]